MKKFMIITHNDLDGIGAAVIGKVVFNKQHVDVKFCGYHNVNEKVMEALKKDIYSHVFITDISVNEETAKIIESEYKGKVSLLDHHSHLDYLESYDWAIVDPGEEGTRGRESGTSLFYKYLLEACKFKPNEAIENFVERVRSYDTWDWANFDNDIDAKKLNDYFGKIGFYDFMNEYTEKLLNNDTELFSELANKVLDITQKNIDNIIKTKNKNLTVKEIDGYKIGFTFTEMYHSEIGNKILTLRPELDAMILIDISRGKISLRSTDNSDFDCSTINKKWFGGGGRKNTGGAHIPEYIMNQIQELLFNKFLQDEEDKTEVVEDLGNPKEEIKEEPKEYVYKLSREDKLLYKNKFNRRYKIKHLSDLDKGVLIENKVSTSLKEILSIDGDRILYTDLKSKTKGAYLHFEELQRKYVITKFLNLNQEFRMKDIKNVYIDLMVGLSDDVYGVEYPLIYNTINDCIYSYVGVVYPDPMKIYSSGTPKQIEHEIRGINGESKTVSEYQLKNQFKVIINDEYK